MQVRVLPAAFGLRKRPDSARMNLGERGNLSEIKKTHVQNTKLPAGRKCRTIVEVAPKASTDADSSRNPAICRVAGGHIFRYTSYITPVAPLPSSEGDVHQGRVIFLRPRGGGRGMVGRNCDGPDDDFRVGFWTSEAGFLSAAELRIIADEIDRQNKTEETK